jgi:superfamily II DNA or RNA helicase
MHKLQVPTLVIVHKEFLMSQWEERLKEYLPNVQVGFAQQEDCSYLGKHVVIGMVHSLASKDYPKAFWSWPGLVVVDEAHRISARTWSNVPSRIRARHRLGLSATPRRKDGTENVFRYHLGREIFAATEKRMKPLIRRVYTEFRLVRSGSFNPTLAPESLILNFLAQSEDRNNRIVELMLEATTAGRKLLIVSKRLEHLRTLEAKFRRAYHKHHQKVASVGWYVGGMSEDARDDSEGKQVILATAQFASEGLDIPALDTVFLTMPMADIEQVVGRILRPSEGKKSPIVVDFRDDYVPVFAAYSRKREEQYERLI